MNHLYTNYDTHNKATPAHPLIEPVPKPNAKSDAYRATCDGV